MDHSAVVVETDSLTKPLVVLLRGLPGVAKPTLLSQMTRVKTHDEVLCESVVKLWRSKANEAHLMSYDAKLNDLDKYVFATYKHIEDAYRICT